MPSKSYNAPVRRPRPEPTDAERWERLSPRELALGTHLDVHGLRKDILCALGDAQAETIAAIEKSQTAVMNAVGAVKGQLDRIETKINGGTGGAEVVTEADKTLAREIRDLARTNKVSAEALDDKTPSVAEPGVNG